MRCFGFDESGTAVIDVEALTIRDCARRVLAGESLSSILDDLNARGVRTSAHKAWVRHSLVRLLTNPRLAGHKGSPPIISDAEHEQLVQVLGAASKAGHGYGNQLKHLLVGFLVCGGTRADGQACGSLLWSQPSNTGNPGYACRGSRPVNGCGRIRIQARQLEDYVTNEALAELAAPAVRARLTDKLKALAGDDGKVAAAIKALDERLAVAAREYAVGELTISTLRAVEKQIKIDRQKLLDYAAQLRLLRELPTADAHALAAWWETATLLRKRDLLHLVIRRVIVQPATRRGSMHLDTNRLRIEWR